MAEVDLRGVSKGYKDTTAVDDLSLHIKDREFVALLGPSGCGKTTTLRMLAGFIRPDSGQILIDGRDVTDVPPERRPTAMVFQSYALWPHMTVADNIAFGLRLRRLPKSEVDDRTARMLEVVGLPGVMRRYLLPRRSSPAASSSASHWHEPSSSARRSFYWTSRSRISTRSFACGCATRSGGSSRSCRSRRSM